MPDQSDSGRDRRTMETAHPLLPVGSAKTILRSPKGHSERHRPDGSANLKPTGLWTGLSTPKFRFASSTRSRPTAERFRLYCVVCGNGVNNISTGGTKKRAKEAEPLKPHSKGVQDLKKFRSSGAESACAKPALISCNFLSGVRAGTLCS